MSWSQRDLDFYLWLDYSVATEEFDRTLPGAFSLRDPDCWMPGTVEAREASNRFAAKLRRIVGHVARDIRQDVDRIPFWEQKRVLETMRRSRECAEIGLGPLVERAFPPPPSLLKVNL